MLDLKFCFLHHVASALYLPWGQCSNSWDENLSNLASPWHLQSMHSPYLTVEIFVYFDEIFVYFSQSIFCDFIYMAVQMHNLMRKEWEILSKHRCIGVPLSLHKFYPSFFFIALIQSISSRVAQHKWIKCIIWLEKN